jgi:poly[(R)-3-hydroxyalkanoate] polymerase subunit PhaC
MGARSFMQESNKRTTGAKSEEPQLGQFDTLARNMVRLFDEGAKVLGNLAERGNGAGPYSMASEAGEATKLLGEIARQWVSEPGKLAAAQNELFKSYADLWGRSFRRFLGEEVKPVIEPAPGDNRFKDPDWSNSQYFDFCKQSYLLTARWAEDLTRNTEGVDDKTRKRALFYLEQMLAALSPSNFALTNPEVMRATIATNAENLVQGMAHLAHDLEHSKDLLRISQTDLSAFEVGKNLAVTPGKIVFQNDLIQLIQYKPTTSEVYERPLLIVPPWINKYYILDLVPEKSFVKWAVDQGFTVFTVSWVNPDGRLAQKTFEDYMHEGILAALGAVTRQTGQQQINALGYCVGGTLLASTLAYMSVKKDDRIASTTFLAAQVDFSEAGDLLVFIDDAQLNSLEEMMAEQGYLDGSRMAAVFNMLRPRDLIWPYVVNNYLLGKKPFPFDLLYWNADSTRLPAANHAFYLREFYHLNRLSKGEMVLDGVKLDLGRVTMPIYELATKEDHIAPASSVFRGSKLFGGPVRYVMAGSGHIAGVVNPPGRKKYQFWSGGAAASLTEWMAKAAETSGSWWPDWAGWLAALSGPKVPARDPSAGPLAPIEDAPGSYVRSRI